MSPWKQDNGSPGGSEGGFTLLEMLIALVIFSTVSLMGALVLRNFSDGQVALADADARLTQIQLSGSVMREDLANALVRPPRGALGDSNGLFFVGGADRRGFGADEEPLLRFVRGGHPAHMINPDFSAVQTLEYWAIDGALVRRSYARPDPTEQTPVNDTRLIADVEEVTIRFRVDGSWYDEVEIAVGVRGRLPELVELAYIVPGRGTVRRVFSVGVNS